MPHVEQSWARRWWRALVSETLATALLMILGVGSMLPPGAPLTHPAFAFGCAVTALIQAFGATSGAHMNPAITLAALIHRQIPLALAGAYVLAQILGAIAGFATLMFVTEVPCVGQECAGLTLPHASVSAPAAVLVEAFLTGTLALVAGALWRSEDPARPDPTVPLKLGFVIAGLVYSGGKLTGASLNPARSVAPALLLGRWAQQWVYWLGPLAGAALAALLQRYVLAPAPPRAPPAPAREELPLHDKADH